MTAYMESLQKLVALEPKVLLPSHGAILANAVERLNALYAHRLRREQQILEAWRQGLRDPVEILPMVYTEIQAREACGEVDVYRSAFRPLKHTLSGRDERSMMKLIVDRASQKVVGAHMVGMDAPEIIQGVAIAIKAGATKKMFDATVGIHPTAAEEFVTMREPVPEPEQKAAE